MCVCVCICIICSYCISLVPVYFLISLLSYILVLQLLSSLINKIFIYLLSNMQDRLKQLFDLIHSMKIYVQKKNQNKPV